MNEPELIQVLVTRDENAFRELVRRFEKPVYNTALHIVQDQHEAEDIAQEVFIRVYEKVGSFRKESSLSTWIYQITVRKSIDKIRRAKTRSKMARLLPWWMPSEDHKRDLPFEHPGILVDQKEKAAKLYEAIRSLPENQRIAFTLIRVQGFSYEEAGRILTLGTKALESLLTRAKANLQRKLEQYRKE